MGGVFLPGAHGLIASRLQLKNEAKLNEFIKTDKELNFDLTTAITVGRCWGLAAPFSSAGCACVCVCLYVLVCVCVCVCVCGCGCVELDMPIR